MPSNNDIVSKRLILSEFSKLFDPLGLLGPVIVAAKLIVQDLWQSGLDWDESIPTDVYTRWINLRSRLNVVDQLKIPRYVKVNSELKSIQIHGFCDASQRAYGACIYVRSDNGKQFHESELLCSKSRVAPLKVISLPRLELSAAVLLARLLFKVKEALSLENAETYLWSDSTIALNWLSSPSRKWSVFLANRVGEVQRLTKITEWHHIASANNPADLLSRGLQPQDLVQSSMWWHGPTFLQGEQSEWPVSSFERLKEIPEQKTIISAIARIRACIVTELATRYSSLNRVRRVVAYCLRFSKKYRSQRLTNHIAPSEMINSLHVMCKAIQMQEFSVEYDALSKGNAINSSSKLLPLSPFLDDSGLLRIGGRLKNANLCYDARHPILLPQTHMLTQRIIEYEHHRNLHAGVQATMAAIRQNFWPISLCSATRKILRVCVTCFRAKPRESETVMSSLPAEGVTVNRPFVNCGVDYAGPVMLREGKRRNAKNHKAYIAIFICFAVKCVHIELVSDLTSEVFLAALKRFISRRGKPARIFSDNGTTFVGANNQLRELFEFWRNDQLQTELERFSQNHEIEWLPLLQ